MFVAVGRKLFDWVTHSLQDGAFRGKGAKNLSTLPALHGQTPGVLRTVRL